MARLLEERGLDTSGFVARALTAPLVGSADLVLTMTRAHRAAVLDLAPAALRRSLLLTELAPLAERLGDDGRPTDDSARLRAVVAGASRVRAGVDLEREAPDVEDPYGRADHVYASVLERIQAECSRIASALRG
jgi:protein-tyrosine phosphatase